MTKKKLKDYKNNPNIKMPYTAWILSHSYIYIIFGIIFLLFISIVLYAGWNSYQNIKKPKETYNPYQDIKLVDSPGKNWAKNLISENPKQDKSKWNVNKNSRPQNILDTSQCGSIKNVPISVLSTYEATGINIKTRIQTYGAGQAAKNFNDYINKMKNCYQSIEVAKNNIGSIAKYDNGFILTMGDGIVSVQLDNLNDENKYIEFYTKRMSETLQQTQCKDLQSTPKDSERSFFYDPKSYHGLDQEKVISTTVKINGIPTPTNIIVNSINNPYATEPESPLPDTLPKMPTEVSEPQIPNPVNNQTSFKKTAVYKIADENGPGCGWAWAGQKKPDYNMSALANTRKAIIDKTQKDVNQEAENYVNKKLSWSFDMALLYPQIDQWNKYVQKVNTVHEKWAWLEEQRALLKPSWDNYVQEHNYWETFDSRKAEAQKQYDSEYKQCTDARKELTDWNDKWGKKYQEKIDKKNSPSPTPTPSSTNDDNKDKKDNTTASPSPSPSSSPTKDEEENIPDPPKGCDNLPERPAIIDQDKPEEPKSPTIPKDVTIPDSWDKP